MPSVLADNGFHKQHETTPVVQNVIKSFLFFDDIDEVYQGTGLKNWDQNSWLLRVDSGCEDSQTDVLVWQQDLVNMPDFVIGSCVGIHTLNKMIRFTTEDIFKSLSIKLLPQEQQPFLSKRKGLLLYSNKSNALTDTLDENLFQYLHNLPLKISVMHYNGTLCCWTQERSKVDLLFEACTVIRSVFESKPFHTTA
ncbi:hypothetical protein CSB45_10230 [candidate division KSB3 bacterium]|uniref:Uncharacterized protein n=1 Tax=candidate division KSB3 bacterium TaxID=2044937 RepID=A0A2G6E3E3_9BACT|nr:MAG: hypothetical protein CSB45_10230 [candidate division KSB3 bacterium]PIE29208.1 MAG: hypothetical protein CSA57_10395 [candidate division KSB3 bacterium]